MAAKFQLEENKSAENARALFLRAIRHHPKVQKLWIEVSIIQDVKFTSRVAADCQYCQNSEVC